MNISNVQQYLNAGSFANRNVQTEVIPILVGNPKNVEIDTEVKLKEIPLPGSKKEEKEAQEKESNWENLVMKPSPISLEERMSQVISPEQVKDLLALIARFPVEDKAAEHNLDVKR
ncbi:MAG: hypothetical protein JJT78_11365 [Leptospira sp.]|nr:hypothetical protein [Leptospira sp.]